MSCRQIEPYVVDFARATHDNSEQMQIAEHVLRCPSCSALLDRERAMSAALKRLAATLATPTHDAGREQALLARFDEAWAQAPAQRNSPLWTRVAAAGLVALASLIWQLARQPTPPGRDGAPATGTPAGSQARTIEPITPSGEKPATGTFEIPGTGGDDVPSDAAFEAADFVVWPGAAAWPPFESGQLIRVDLPVDLLPSLGFAEPEPEALVVQADVLVGQDGFARAVRLVQ
jgi:hypothetical protein